MDREVIQEIANDPSTRALVLDKINRVRAVTGDKPLAELPTDAIPMEPCRCIFGSSLPDVHVFYGGESDIDTPHDDITVEFRMPQRFSLTQTERIAEILEGELVRRGGNDYVVVNAFADNVAMQFMWAFDHWMVLDLVDDDRPRLVDVS
jgi:hypothetical protein